MAFLRPFRLANGQTYQLPIKTKLARVVGVIDAAEQGKLQLNQEGPAGSVLINVAASTPLGTSYVPIECGFEMQVGDRLYNAGDSILLIFE